VRGRGSPRVEFGRSGVYSGQFCDGTAMAGARARWVCVLELNWGGGVPGVRKTELRGARVPFIGG
jgi:hypothetical protein